MPDHMFNSSALSSQRTLSPDDTEVVYYPSTGCHLGTRLSVGPDTEVQHTLVVMDNCVSFKSDDCVFISYSCKLAVLEQAFSCGLQPLIPVHVIIRYIEITPSE